MKKACILVADDFYRKNRLFNLDDKVANRDNCLYPFYLLKEKFAEIGIDLATDDVHAPEESEYILYNEVSNRLPSSDEVNKSYLLIFESEVIKPENWVPKTHQKFKKVFTWHDEFADGIHYFKINFSQLMPDEIPKELSSKSRFCTLIAGNKKVKHPLELYSKRVEAIRWFEKNKPNDFDLYGVGWNEFRFHGSKLIRALNRVKPLTKLLAPSFPSYRGMVAQKKDVLEKYKFAICYENARDIPGYITEKIFDCFFAGCVPIYWGANNVEQHIPKECFIDKRAFSTYGQLYDYLKNMSDEEYLGRLYAIEAFLTSDKAKPFSIDYFVNTVVTNVISDMKPE